MSWRSIASITITAEERERIISQVAAEVLREADFALLRNRSGLKERAEQALTALLSREGIAVAPTVRQALLAQVIAKVSGLGFLDPFLPPACNDFTDIVLNPDGTLWGLRKGGEFFEKLDVQITKEEAWRVVEALLAPTGKSLSEATPTVDARLPRGDGFGGARVKIQHPCIVPSRDGFPAISIRIFEPRPVKPEWLVEREMFSPELMAKLLEWVRRKYRMLIIGETKAGKTTTLSALLHGIPSQARVVKIEDPEEIWLDPDEFPNVVTLEARHQIPGSPVPPYRIKDGVDDALRMAPNWLVVGEVRTGDAALALFRAQMSDHPGLSTFHAAGPAAAVQRLCAIMFADEGVRIEAAKMFIAAAVDIIVWVGFEGPTRRCLGVWEVLPELKGGNVAFRTLWKPGEGEILEPERRRQ